MTEEGSTQSYGDDKLALLREIDAIIQAAEELGPITAQSLIRAAVQPNLARSDAPPGPKTVASAKRQFAATVLHFRSILLKHDGPLKRSYTSLHDDEDSGNSSDEEVYYDAYDGPLKRLYPNLHNDEDSGNSSDEEDYDDAYDHRDKRQRLSLRGASPASSEIINIDDFPTIYRDFPSSFVLRPAVWTTATGRGDVRVNDDSDSEDEDADDSRGKFMLKTLVKWDEVAEETSNAQGEDDEEEEDEEEAREPAAQIESVPQNPRFAIRNLLN
ncbi:hypothetical protein DFP72DRAFT_1077253 [Ephemerocybe angulata]|uniref:Uncharacterized protein n=1 Tax=Ephemerocybe angulata TaxID=980116 RepID=A0A8H6HER8_9AGAR|nr:hypothetical protein DFP72DRAFT_1077253 [Tulosesus angulatus]